MEKGRGRKKSGHKGVIDLAKAVTVFTTSFSFLEASLLWLLSSAGFSSASLQRLTLSIHWDEELKGYVTIHRRKEKSGREAGWGFATEGNVRDICHDEWDSKEKSTHLEPMYCIMQFPLFVTISSRTFNKTDAI